MANPLSYPVQGVPVPVTVNEAYFALGRVLLPEPDYLPPTEAHKQTASSGKAPDEAPKLENANQRFAFLLISDSHSSFLAGSLLICGCKPQMLWWSLTSTRGIVAACRRRGCIASAVNQDLDTLDLFL